MSNAIIKLIDQKAEELRLALDIIADQKKVEEALKAELSELIATLPESTYRVEWAQLQNVTKREWAYRDSAVTAAQKEVEKAEDRLAYVKKLLKGAQDAAKAAKKAKVSKETVSLRVVRGKAGTPAA